MPSESQESLITADHLYWLNEGRKGDILEELRLAVEPVLEKILLAPFHRWCSAHARQPAPRERGSKEVFLRLSRLLDELWADRTLFEDFARDTYPKTSRTYWDDLREKLYALRDLRGSATHPEGRPPTDPQRITDQYRRFVGIGEPGLLATLLSISRRSKD